MSSRSVPIESPYANTDPISYGFGVIAAYCSNFRHCVFEPPFGGLATMYDVLLGLIGKRVVDFLYLVLLNFFR